MRSGALIIALVLSVSAGATDIAGKWNMTAEGPDGSPVKAQVTLRWDGATLAGSVQFPEGDEKLQKLAFKDDLLTCVLTYDDTDVSISMKREGDTLKGTYQADGLTGAVQAIRAAEGTNGLAGVWKLTTAGPEGDIALRLTLKQEQGAWKGSITTDAIDEDLAVENVKVDGAAVTFEVPTQIGTYKVSATVNGDRFEGVAADPYGAKNPIKGGR